MLKLKGFTLIELLICGGELLVFWRLSLSRISLTPRSARKVARAEAEERQDYNGAGVLLLGQ